MGVILTILTCWDDPPGSGGRVGRSFGEEGGRWLMMMMMMMMKWKDLTWAIDKTNIFAPKDSGFQWESPSPEVYFEGRTVNFRESISVFFFGSSDFPDPNRPTGLSPAETRRPKAVELYKSHQDKIS